ncbi:Rrf2 family transcriptional regulator [Rhodovastum atsumiense]|uniref:Rrf2 family transcriptional regulator n=1 Tax=Rhodovastum atsumiense TaxID=504468 RepID=A0A5M6IZA2_9PROT|nr:Rrf2 family transcriptional regulator [Rhodovastum atsumiense]KAA5613680.1 Rrf2 family transcriptional regulator [Rhodovastum atsumiense]CAH2599595.1 Rrf2 family transcriptional regulator [Rhodovastum atsumiense]
MIATRFAVAVHILLLLALAGEGATVTSLRLAGRLRTNPVVIRRITAQLARAELLRIRRGPGGAGLARPAAAVTLADIWHAVDAGSVRPLIPMHAGGGDAEGRRIHATLSHAFATTEKAFQAALADVTLADLLQRMQQETGAPALPASRS